MIGKLFCDVILLLACLFILATAAVAFVHWRRISRGERAGAAVLTVLALVFVAALALPVFQTP